MHSIAEQILDAMNGMGYSIEKKMQRPGLSLAVVTNVNDEQKLNRVKCLPIENEQLEETCYDASEISLLTDKHHRLYSCH